MTPNAHYLKDAKECRDRAHGLEVRHPLPSLLQARVERGVRRHDHLGGLVVGPRVLLDEAGDANALLGEYLADRGQDAGPVLDADPVVGARLHLAYRDDADPVVEAERGPALHAASDRARQLAAVADDRRRRRPAPRTLAHKHHLADQVAFHEHGVLGAFDTRQRMLERDHRRVHSGLDPARVALGVRDELDRVAELAGVPEVDGLHAVDPLAKDVVGADLDLVRDRAQDRELVGRVVAADVLCGVSLGVAGLLRLTDRVSHRAAGVHAAEDVVRRAVYHGRDALDTVGLYDS